MISRQKRQGRLEYAPSKDIHERISALEEAAKHTATREWVLLTPFKVGGALVGALIGIGVLVWRLLG